MKYGLDFGTSNSSISVNDKGQITVLPVEKTDTPEIMPSFWYFDHFDNNWYFGQDALDEYKNNGWEGRFIQSLKKVLGDADYHGSIIDGKFVKFDYLVELFFNEIKKRADNIVGNDVKEVKIGVPIKISGTSSLDVAKKRISTAAGAVGFEKIGFMYEPLAATYILKDKIEKPSYIFTLDIGGGTTDTSIVRLSPDFEEQDQVLSYDGIGVGGTDFSSIIMKERLLEYFGKGTTYTTIFGKEMPFPPHYLSQATQWNISSRLLRDRKFLEFFDNVKETTNDPEKIEALEKLLFEQLGLHIFQAVEDCKMKLSHEESSEVVYNNEQINIREKIIRSQFESYIGKPYEDISFLIDRTLNLANLNHEQIDSVLLVGGSTMIPLFHDLLKDKFPHRVIHNPNIFSSVAYGLSSASYQEVKL